MQLKYYTHLFSGLKALLTTVCLTVSSLSFAQPANDDCSGAINIPGPITPTCTPVSGNTLTATASTQIPTCRNTLSRDVWYSFTANAAFHRISLTGVTKTNANAAYYYVGLAVYSGACGSLTSIGCSTLLSSGTPPAPTITLTNLTPGVTYYVQVWMDISYDSGLTQVANDINFNLCITAPTPPPSNDNCTGARPLYGNSSLTDDNTAATTDIINTNVTCGYSSLGRNNGLWYKLTPTTSGSLSITSCGSTFDTYLRVYTGGSCAAFTTCAGSNDNDCGSQATVTFNAVANTTYYILATGFGTTGTINLTTTGVPLKVDMGTLSGKMTAGNYARLNWTTYNEDNNQGFEIQRSADGKLFEYAGFVHSKGANGNSTEAQTYDFTDPVAATDRVFYRLKQTNTDQSVAYSNVISLGSDQGSFSLTATPNPATNKLNLKIRGRGERTGQLLVTDLSGKVCRNITIHNDNTEIDLSALASGIYLLKYVDAQYTQTIKIQKQ